MKKLSLLIIGMLLLAPVVIAMDGCEFTIDPGVACMARTPYLTGACSSYTYDMYYPNNTIAIDDGTMTQVGSTGVYNFTINQNVEGSYHLILCDNSTSSFSIETTISSYITNSTSLLYQYIWGYSTREITGGSITISTANTCQVWNSTLCVDRTTTGVVEEG